MRRNTVVYLFYGTVNPVAVREVTGRHTPTHSANTVESLHELLDIQTRRKQPDQAYFIYLGNDQT